MKSKPAHFRIIDGSVLLTMAVCAVIAIAVIAFRFKDYTPCTPAAISVQPGPKYVGELIRFKAITNDKKGSFIWDFGDESPFQESGMAVSHSFKKPGRYQVALSTGKQCNGYTTIYVLTRRIIDESSQPDFMGPTTAEVGTPATFVDATPHASKWEWRFGETNYVDATKQKVTYTFQTPGTKKVILIVNGKMRGELLVLVIPRPINKPLKPRKPRPLQLRDPKPPVASPIDGPAEAKEEQKPKMADVSQEQLQMILTGIVEGNNTAGDLSKYFCDTTMEVNLNGELMSLDKLQQKLRKIRKDRRIRDLEITTEKDADVNCIKAMHIKLERRRIF